VSFPANQQTDKGKTLAEIISAQLLRLSQNRSGNYYVLAN